MRYPAVKISIRFGCIQISVPMPSSEQFPPISLWQTKWFLPAHVEALIKLYSFFHFIVLPDIVFDQLLRCYMKNLRNSTVNNKNIRVLYSNTKGATSTNFPKSICKKCSKLVLLSAIVNCLWILKLKRKELQKKCWLDKLVFCTFQEQCQLMFHIELLRKYIKLCLKSKLSPLSTDQ